MPLYDFECECGKVTEHYAGINEKRMPCDCGKTAKRIISTRYYINPDVDFVTDNITGSPVRVTSRKQLASLCKENGVHQKIGKGWI